MSIESYNSTWQLNLRYVIGRYAQISKRSAKIKLIHTPILSEFLPGSASADASGKEAGLHGAQTAQTVRASGSSQAPVSVKPLLDNKVGVSRHGNVSSWSRKTKRAYGRCLSGIKRAMYFKRFVFHLTLTSVSPQSYIWNKKTIGFGHNIARDWDLFSKRLKRELGFSIDYFKVQTMEGHGVIHALVVCDDFMKCSSLVKEGDKKPQLRKYWSFDTIHAYCSCLWSELHDSPNVWVRQIDNASWASAYVCNQYLASQSLVVRISYSVNWLFRGFVKKMHELIRLNGFRNGIRLLDLMLKTYVPDKKPFIPDMSFSDFGG